jgi:hypothetical protein
VMSGAQIPNSTASPEEEQLVLVVVEVGLVGRTLGSRLGVVLDPVVHRLGTWGRFVVVGSSGGECTCTVVVPLGRSGCGLGWWSLEGSG